MNTELVINGTLAIVGAGLLAAGIITLVRHKSHGQTIFGAVATAVGTIMLLIVLLTTSVSSSSGSVNSSSGQQGGAIIDNGALITGKVTSIDRLDSPWPWQIGIEVDKIENLGDLPNAVSARAGQVLTVHSDQNLEKLNAGQEIKAEIKLSGDVEGETFLYLSAIE
jgi:hypothetical protein